VQEIMTNIILKWNFYFILIFLIIPHNILPDILIMFLEHFATFNLYEILINLQNTF